MSAYKKPKSIYVYSFGRVDVPMQVDRDNGRLETVISFGVSDLDNLLHEVQHYYRFKSEQTHRQSEIAELAWKLGRLIRKEKSLDAALWSPIKLKNDE